MLHVIVGAGRYRLVDGQMGAAACAGRAAEVSLEWPDRETCDRVKLKHRKIKHENQYLSSSLPSSLLSLAVELNT
jgi:hypothetical protein